MIESKLFSQGGKVISCRFACRSDSKGRKITVPFKRTNFNYRSHCWITFFVLCVNGTFSDSPDPFTWYTYGGKKEEEEEGLFNHHMCENKCVCRLVVDFTAPRISSWSSSSLESMVSAAAASTAAK